MLNNKKYLHKSIIALVAFSCFIFGQTDFSFKNISVKDGLAESTVKVIYEDQKGFIYFGTENGLDVFDGYEFTNYQMNSFNELSLLGNKISTIYEDASNMIWVGTELGISKFDPSKRELTNKLEQLRFLDNGLNIYVSYYDKNIPHGIDTQEDLINARKHFKDAIKRKS